jgi:hypothetical protein
MKCYFLDSIKLTEDSKRIIDRMFPESGTWVLRHESGDPMAYFDFNLTSREPELKAPYISACISSRHYGCDAQVLAVLESLRADIGGRILDDK